MGSLPTSSTNGLISFKRMNKLSLVVSIKNEAESVIAEEGDGNSGFYSSKEVRNEIDEKSFLFFASTSVVAL